MTARVLFVTTGLSVGGAENALLTLLSHLDRSRFEPHVYVLTEKMDLAPRIEALGISVASFGITSPARMPTGLLRLSSAIRRLQPAVVQTWMYHADLLGALAARFVGIRRIAWSLHNTDLSSDTTARTTRLIVKACAHLSRALPTAILSCSVRARDVHVALGYDPARFRIIPNGFDTATFRPDASVRSEVRAELRIPADAIVLTMLGRYHPQKNHLGLLRTLRRVLDQRPALRFLLAGTDVTPSNETLATAWRQLGLESSVSLLGYRADTARLLCASDALVLPSLGEAFPLVVGEAMSTGRPCIVNDVGDAAMMVGDTGMVVPPGDEAALAAAIVAFADLPTEIREQRGARARERVRDLFDIRQVVAKYEDFYIWMKRA